MSNLTTLSRPTHFKSNTIKKEIRRNHLIIDYNPDLHPLFKQQLENEIKSWEYTLDELKIYHFLKNTLN